MRARVLVLLSLLVVALLGAIFTFRRPVEPSTETRTASAPKREAEPDLRLAFAYGADAATLRATLAAAYRPGVDRRMLDAVSDVRTFMAGGDTIDLAAAEFTGGLWHVRCGADDAGTLPEFPRFDDAMRLLDAWAARELAAHPLPDGAPDGAVSALIADQLPQVALATLDAAAQKQGVTRASVAQALEAGSQLALLLANDRSGYADSVMMRTLSWLALARAADHTPHARERAALAWAMGYLDDARTTAATLPANDALAALVLDRRATLTRLSSDVRAPRETRVLQLLQLASDGEFEPWIQMVEGTARPGSEGMGALFATALAFRRFDVGGQVGRALTQVSLENVPGAPAGAGLNGKGLLAFERSLARPEQPLRGRMSGGTLVNARRAVFYSGLVAEHEFVSKQLASVHTAKQFRDALASAANSPGAGFVLWQNVMTNAMLHEATEADLRALLTQPGLPGRLALETFEALSLMHSYGTSPMRVATRSLAARIDTRPSYMIDYAEHTQLQVMWPELTEKLYSHAAACAGGTRTSAHLLLALMREDHAGLAAAANDPGAEPSETARMLRVCLAADSSVAPQVLARYAPLAAAPGATLGLVQSYAKMLDSRGRYAEAERVMAAWIATCDSTSDALDMTIATTTLARMQRMQGRIADALTTIEPEMNSMQKGAMHEAAVLLLAHGREREAFALAEQARARYPQSPRAQVFPVLLMWRAGRDADAARALAQPDAKDRFDKGELAEGFAEVFGRRHDAARAALDAMRGVVPSIYPLLWQLSSVYSRSNDLAFAAELARRSNGGSGANRAYGLVEVYGRIADAAGADSALVWLNTQYMAVDIREFVAGRLLVQGQARAARAVLAADPACAGNEYAVLLRASAWRLEGARDAAERDSLHTMLAAIKPGAYERLARYMLGEITESDALQLAADRKRQNEVWFFCGLRAWADGRANDAVTWLVLCEEAGMTSDGEYLWAHDRLLNWSQRWRAADRLRMGTPRPA
ncbi:MAG: hypothetical protein K8R56_07660 [Candidatus Eisenbacteria bacterium]|nr:hypothetical protein [Candidatus Eisenbacteria bacterium]